jgi:hypothetical protein
VISRRHLYLVLTLLMPLLTLRALLPAGYMVAAAGDGARIVLCSEGFAALHAPADASQQPQPAGDGDGDGDCAFAHAASSAPPPHYVAGAFIPALEVGFRSAVADALPPATGPPRHAGARAPPAFL